MSSKYAQMFGLQAGRSWLLGLFFYDEGRRTKVDGNGKIEGDFFVLRLSSFVRQKELQLTSMKFVMRFTVIDENGTVSFVAPCNALKALVAACSKFPADLESLLAASEPYDSDLKENVMNSLALFDEHNGDGQYDRIHNMIDYADEQRTHHNIPAFRVVDETTREESLRPVKAGLVLFNLKERRIIQVHNTYDSVRRQDRGRIHKGGEPTNHLYHYELPMDWQIVP